MPKVHNLAYGSPFTHKLKGAKKLLKFPCKKKKSGRKSDINEALSSILFHSMVGII